MTSRRRRIAVVKVGGDVVQSAEQLAGLGHNVRELLDDDWDVIVLHGGGPQTTALQERLGLKSTKIGGRRVTSRQDLIVVTQAVCGEVNVALTCSLLGAGVRGFGCHGASGGMIEADKRPPMVVPGHGPEPVDFGEVGDVLTVDEVLLRGLLHLGVVPVIATLGVSSLEGRAFNINADTVAVEIARTLGAELLLLVTAVGGVFRRLDDPSTRLGTLTTDRARALIADGTIAGGMIPKVEEALTLLDLGVGAVAILDAATPHAFTSAARGDGAVGTRLTV